MGCDNCALLNHETMIETKDITKMVAHIVRRDNGIADTSIMHPMREWMLGLAVVFLLVAGGVGFNVLMYQNYHDALTTPVAVTETIVPYKAAPVARAINYYEAERVIYESILGIHVSNVPVVVAGIRTEATSTELIGVKTVTSTTSATGTKAKLDAPIPVVPEIVPQPAG